MRILLKIEKCRSVSTLIKQAGKSKCYSEEIIQIYNTQESIKSETCDKDMELANFNGKNS